MNYERIDELLAQKGMSRRQLAVAAGISIDTISSWYRRQTRKVPMKYIKAIAKVLNVPYWELIIIGDDMDVSSVMLEMLSDITERQTGYTNEQLITDFRRLTVASQQYIVQQMHERFKQEQAELRDAIGYYYEQEQEHEKEQAELKAAIEHCYEQAQGEE